MYMASFAGDPYERLDNEKHQHAGKLNKVYQRTSIWKEVGPSVTEHEWEEMVEAQQYIEDLMSKCKNNINYKISKDMMFRLNHYYRLYKIGNKN